MGLTWLVLAGEWIVDELDRFAAEWLGLILDTIHATVARITSPIGEVREGVRIILILFNVSGSISQGHHG